VRAVGIDLIVEVCVVDVDFVRVDSHNRAILTMQFLDLPEESSSTDGIVVELVKESESSELGSWNSRYGGQIETIDNNPDNTQSD
jgi:hypothetical protein